MSFSPVSPAFVSNQGGVLMAADTLGSYGSMARFPDLNRIMKVFHERTYSYRIFSCGCQCPFPPSPASISHPPASCSRPSTFTSFHLQVNDTTVLGAGGDYADFQFISDVSFIRTVFSQNETFISYVFKLLSVDCSVNF